MTTTYQWTGITQNGQHTTGNCTANNDTAIKDMLCAQGITVLSYKKNTAHKFITRTKISTKDIAAFTQKLDTLLSSGLSLGHAITTLEKQPGKLSPLITAIASAIEAGDALSDALKSYPQYFDTVYIALVLSGEQTGQLPNVFAQLSHLLDQRLALNAKIKHALFYPCMTLAFSLLITLGMLLFVVPQFEEIFSSFGASLPPFTQAVVTLSNFIKHHFLSTTVMLGVLCVASKILNQHIQPMHTFLQSGLLHIPFIRSIVKNIQLTRWANVATLALSSGITPMHALTLASKTLTIRTYQTPMRAAEALITDGASLASALATTQLFSQEQLQLIEIGETAGRLAPLFEKIAELEQKNSDNSLDKASKLIEPLMMIFIAGLVGSLIIAMYLPIFTLGTAI